MYLKSWLVLICTCLLMDSWVANAKTKEQRLVLSDRQHKLLRLEQNGIDAQIHVFNEETGKQVKAVSFPWNKGLPEYLYLSQKDCRSCRILFKSTGASDEKELEVKIETLNDANELPFWDQLNQAGGLALKANQQRGEKKRRTLEALVAQLQTALRFATTDDQQWHCQTLLAEAYAGLGSTEKQQAVLAEILQSSNSELGVLYRIHALYETAAYEKRQAELAKLYNEGMSLSKQLGSDRLYATGANYKAVNHVRNGEFDVAVTLLKQSVALLEAERNWRDMLYPLHNLSWTHQRAGDLPRSLEYAVQQRLLSRRFEVPDHQILGLYNMAMAYGQLGELGKAEQFLDQAIDRFESRPSDSALSTILGAYLLEERARRLLEQGAFADAADVAKKSKLSFEASALPARVADAIYLEGQIAFARNDLDQARQKYHQVIEYDREHQRRRALGLHLLRLAELEIYDEQFLIAADYQAEALSLLKTTDDKRQLAAGVVQSAQLLILLGDYESASAVLQDIETVIAQVGLPVDKARHHYFSALALSSLNQSERAIEDAAKAQSLVESTLANIQRYDLKRHFLALHRSIVDLHVELLARQESQAPQVSLALAESIRARTLKKKLALSENQLNAEATYTVEREALLREIQTQAGKWHAAAQYSSNTLSTTRALGRQLYKIEAQHAKLAQQPEMSVTEDTIESDTVREARPGELIVFYFVGERRSWLWLKDEQSISLHVLPKVSELRPLITRYREVIDTPPSSRQGQDAWAQRDAISDLAKVILGPVATKLRTQRFSELTLLPDQHLHSIPFTPLVASLDETTRSNQVAIRNDASLSISTGGAVNHWKSGKDRTILVVADVEHDSTIAKPSLVYSATEARAIKSVFANKAKVLIGGAANKSAVMGEFGRDYDILHFATHGLVHEQEPLLSGLALTPDSQGRLLLVPEISNLKLKRKMVVLSACDSAVGQLVWGEGALSLSRAFMEAGASHIIGSLWPVQDQASAELMSLFYQALSQPDATPASALRSAQLSLAMGYQGKWSDPYYWSGFQVHRASH